MTRQIPAIGDDSPSSMRRPVDEQAKEMCIIWWLKTREFLRMTYESLYYSETAIMIIKSYFSAMGGCPETVYDENYARCFARPVLP